MRELAVQSSTDTNTDADRLEIQKEIDQLATEVTRISTDTEFNTMKLLDASYVGKKFHIGANERQNVALNVGNMDADSLLVSGQLSGATAVTGLADVNLYSRTMDDITIEFEVGAAGSKTEVSFKPADPEDNDTVGTITVTLGNEDSTAVDVYLNEVVKALKSVAGDAGVVFETGENFDGSTRLSAAPDEVNIIGLTADPEVEVGINVSSQQFADAAITTINDALETVSSERSKLGAMQNRLEHTIANLGKLKSIVSTSWIIV